MRPRMRRAQRTALAASAMIAALAIVAGSAGPSHPAGFSSTAYAQEPPRQERTTVWDGVFTTEQAKRGSALYGRRCMPCHGPELNGGDNGADDGISLTGGYWATWRGQTVAELFRVVSTKMPRNAPGQLTPQEYADVISFLLEANSYPAGKSELPPDTTRLEQIVFVDKP